jgi:hypothetical protein
MNLILMTIFTVLLVGCTESPKDFATSPVSNDVGQTVTFVETSKIHGWVTEHKNLKIVSITGYGAGTKDYGGYIIVYETPKVEK